MADRPDDEELRQQLAAVVVREREEGCYLGPDGPAEVDRIVDVAVRRWRSQPRRVKGRATHERRVEDLAKGLATLYEADPHHVGPEMVHYRHVAASLAEVLARQP